ncbi:hypothetical protein SBF1_1870005 [Candidatus Desulfosporosinus infrequens]|uniref:Uncharacterized protein n=1 Tax=Candidatus Desulfosporosinus infrequens TaxID=2043169 RepID=A0A2U3KDJ2_9FIRM|nr:hypothetical protein SBF1_1870005 [Candidatus Desulfosporosinus infrequens]
MIVVLSTFMPEQRESVLAFIKLLQRLDVMKRTSFSETIKAQLFILLLPVKAVFGVIPEVGFYKKSIKTHNLTYYCQVMCFTMLLR